MLARGRVVIDLVVISPPRYEVPATLVDVKYKLNMVSQYTYTPAFACGLSVKGLAIGIIFNFPNLSPRHRHSAQRSMV